VFVPSHVPVYTPPQLALVEFASVKVMVVLQLPRHPFTGRQSFSHVVRLPRE